MKRKKNNAYSIITVKKLFILCFCSLVANVNSQTNETYESLIAKAGLFHLQKDYKNAIALYEKAFAIQKPDALASFKAAGVYSLNHDADQGFRYLTMALDSGWTEADWLTFDPYLDYLRESNPAKWQELKDKAQNIEEKYTQTLQLGALRKEINRMTLEDQQLRFQRVQTNNDSLLAILDRKINQSDLENLNRAKQIIRQYGWPKIIQIGKDGQNNLWLIVQHADQDVLFQRTALNAMEKLNGSAELNMENYAFLYDRVQCNLNYKQLYGTQVVWTQHGKASAFRPIADESKVDDRRKKLNLEPLYIYALNYGFAYKKLTESDSKQKDKAYHKQVQSLIDSAKDSYKNKEFQKAYDYYNEASTFLGGMSEKDNFEAAILFSEIASLDNNPQYPSIALDFLDLLSLRKTVTKSQLKHKDFTVLQGNKRWITINNRLTE